MPKRIILLSDGTGNSAAKVWRTNVWRTFESIDLTKPDQIAIYDDGVGTSSFKPAAILGGAFGFGLKRNVLSLYKFLCRNYKSKAEYQKDGIVSEDDDIFGFGFSRGAFTIRVLIGLVLEQGLVRADTEAQLDQKAKSAYREYRRNFKTKTGLEVPFRKLRDGFFWLVRKLSAPSVPDVHTRVEHIRFLGLWDTVAAYGFPVDEMTYGVSRYIWPLELPDRRLNPRVRRACHALSLDDERTTFHPILWDETELWESGELPVKPNLSGKRLTTDEKISQVWFAGVHANIGGGYPDDSLAHVSLNWMLDQAKACDLRFKATEVDRSTSNNAGGTDKLSALAVLKDRQDPHGRLYDSRSGLGGYYRYGPRSVADLANSGLSTDRRDVVSVEVVKIHETAFSRMNVNAHSYAPISLPGQYEIVTSDSRIVSQSAIKPTANARSTYETATSAQARYQHQENIVWSYVWRRRIIYFLTVVASLHLVLYPLVSSLPDNAEQTTRLRPLSDLIRLIALVLPSGLERWIKVYAGDPAWFVVSAGAVAALMWASAQIKGRINDEMAANWRVSFTASPYAPSPRGTLSPFSFGFLYKAIFTALAVVALYRPLVWMWPSIPRYLGRPLAAFLDRTAQGFILFLIVGALAALLLPTPPIARFRTQDAYKRIVLAMKRKYMPLAFAVLLPFLVLSFGSHYLFNIRDGFGSFCEETRIGRRAISDSNSGLKICTETDRTKCLRTVTSAPAPICRPGDNCTGKVMTFETSNICTATGVFLEKNARYQLIVEQDGPWSFANTPSSTKGMPITAFAPPANSDLETWFKARGTQALMFLMYPFKRTFNRPWGHIIVRYGSTGSEESFIDPGEERQSNRREELFTPQRDGEMFIYLNQPVLGLWADALGFFNSGQAKITITRVPRR